ncbi:MAG: hypothetical protein ACI4JS_11925, partial [Oscillospiraceae bacterium]
MMMCSRCKKRPAVMFISTMSGTDRKSEGLCLSCAKELKLPQVNEYLQQMGISEDDIDNACESLFGENGILNDDMFGKLITDKDDMEDIDDDLDEPDDDEKEEDGLFERGGAGTMPNFLRNLFGMPESGEKKEDKEDRTEEDDSSEKKPRKKSEKVDKKRKCLETFCTNLTRRAKEGKIDKIVGREKEIYRVIQILSRRT